jgi:hypothetical protein
MTFAHWFKPVQALAPASPSPALPTVTPAQVVTEVLVGKVWVTQGELLDACKASGLAPNYSGLQAALRSLQQAGVIAHRFELLEDKLPVLVYYSTH